MNESPLRCFFLSRGFFLRDSGFIWGLHGFHQISSWFSWNKDGKPKDLHKLEISWEAFFCFQGLFDGGPRAYLRITQTPPELLMVFVKQILETGRFKGIEVTWEAFSFSKAFLWGIQGLFEDQMDSTRTLDVFSKTKVGKGMVQMNWRSR